MSDAPLEETYSSGSCKETIDKMNLKEENDFLQESLKRCMAELHLHQKQSECTEYPPKQGIDLPNWIMTSKGVSPLFIAYDQRINETTKLLNDQGKKLEDMTERSHRLLNENAFLRKAQTEALKSALSTKKTTGHNSNTSSDDWRERVLVLKKENTVIHEQCALLVEELNVANGTVATRDKSIATLSEEALKSASALKYLENQIEQLSTEKQLCERELIKTASEKNGYQERIREIGSHLQHTRDRNVELEAIDVETKELRAELEKEVYQTSKMVSFQLLLYTY